MIYIVSLYYLPLTNPPATRMGHLVKLLIKKYGKDQVIVVTGRPNYPDGRLAPEYRRRLFKKKTGPWGETVHHLYEYPTPFQGLYRKTFGLMSFAASVLIYFLFKRIQKKDLIFITTGPSFPVYALYLLKKIKRNVRYVLDVRDLWPQVVAGMGFLKADTLPYKLLDRLSNITYREAEKIVGVSEGINHHLHTVTSTPLTLISNPIDMELFQPCPPEGTLAFKTRHHKIFDAPNRITILFAGSYSFYVGLMTLMEAVLRTLPAADNFRVILIGEGEEKPMIRNFIAKHHLREHVLLLPFLKDKREIVQWINAADVCFASLRDSAHLRYAIPTKILEYMSCDKKTLVGLKGPFADKLQENGVAVVIDPGDVQKLHEQLVQLINKPHQSLLKASPRAFVKNQYSLQNFNKKFSCFFSENYSCCNSGEDGV